MPTTRLHGPAVKVIRQAKGIRANVLSGRVGISPSYLSNIEKGIRQPSPAVTASLARELGVTLDDITYVIEGAA